MDELERSADLGRPGVTEAAEPSPRSTPSQCPEPWDLMKAGLMLAAPLVERPHVPVEHAARIGGSPLGAIVGGSSGPSRDQGLAMGLCQRHLVRRDRKTIGEGAEGGAVTSRFPMPWSSTSYGGAGLSLSTGGLREATAALGVVHPISAPTIRLR